MRKREWTYIKAYARGDSGELIVKVFYTLRTLNQITSYMNRIYLREFGYEPVANCAAVTSEKVYCEFLVNGMDPFTALEYKSIFIK